MPRYKLTIEYDGRPFAGWQRQENGPSVQAALEDAASALDEARVSVFGAGRTDAGVHALGQVAHLDLGKDLPGDTVRDAINHHLGANPVAVLVAERAADGFHARFDATARRYRYRIVNRRAPLTFERGLAWRLAVALDAEAMHDAAQVLLGRHDFTTFRDAQCQAKSPIKTLDRLDVSRRGEAIEITSAARSFLHRQVRSMTGALVEVGRGKLTKAGLAAMLAAKDRASCAPVAPPDGLYLEAVDYGPKPVSDALQDQDL